MAEEIDDLYGLPAGEFVAARNDLAKRLRADGDREGADEVKALRKPSVVAAAVNRALRSHEDARDELLDAGVALREAQENVRGKGGRAAMRDAAERERTAVNALTAVAEKDAGLSAATTERARDTLHAAALDDDARELVAAARLERELEAVSVGPLSLAPAPATDESDEEQEQEDEAAEALAEAEGAAEAAREELERAQAAEAEAKQALDVAKADVRAARKEVGARERDVKRLKK